MDEKTNVLPSGTANRKIIPMATGVLDYFPAALAEVAKLSKAGNDKHNPGEPLHWARGKSMDHADCIMRHLTDRGTIDPEDGIRHSAKIAWRALALLQEELEAAGLATLPRGAKVAKSEFGKAYDEPIIEPKRTRVYIKMPGFADSCVAPVGQCPVCWREVQLGEMYDPKNAVVVNA